MSSSWRRSSQSSMNTLPIASAEMGVMALAIASASSSARSGVPAALGPERTAATMPPVTRWTTFPRSQARLCSSSGDLVYKSREPGEKDYDLPDKYANHFDQRDYYHVGVVTGVNPLKITHCTSASDANGILIDQKLGQWSWHGCLTKIDGKEPNPSTSVQAVVTADSGRTVNLRKSPSKSATVLERVPIGDVVEVTNENGEWCAVKYKGKSGYMMSCFLYFGDIANDMIFVSAGELAKLSSALNDAIAAVNEMMNGGVG